MSQPEGFLILQQSVFGALKIRNVAKVKVHVISVGDGRESDLINLVSKSQLKASPLAAQKNSARRLSNLGGRLIAHFQLSFFQHPLRGGVRIGDNPPFVQPNYWIWILAR